MHDSTLGRILFLLFAILSLRYLWVRLRVVLPERSRIIGALLFVALLFSTFAYRIFDFGPTMLGRFTFALGGFWMVALSNWLVVCLLLDFQLFLRWMKRHFLDYSSLARRRDSRIPLFAFLTLILTIGFWAYGVPHQLNFKVNLQKVELSRALAKPIRVAVLSDIHFDPLFPISKWKRLLEEVSKAKPDVILLVGDLSDFSSQDLEAMHMGRLMHFLKAPQGVFATTGNHEAYMERRDPSLMDWFRKNGVTWLLDESVCVESLCITGRLDQNYAPHATSTGVRKTLPEIAPNWSQLAGRAWLMMDHQPKGLLPEDAMNIMPDLGISGHTHAGQFFPWTVVINWIWPLAEGRGELNGVPWITSSGFGQWGPALRVGSDTELLILDIQ